MDYSDILQDISVDLSFMVKKHLKNIKKLDSKKQKAFGKLFGDMKQGVDDLSESVNEAKYHKSKDSKGMRYAGAIYNNAMAIIDRVMDDKADAKEVVSIIGPILINAIKATIKHKFKPAPGKEKDLKKFQSKLKEFLKLTEALVKKPSKAGVKRLETMHREWWNFNFGAAIVLNGDFMDSIVELNEAKYNYKQDAMNAYMNGKISAKELDRISKEDFKSSVATKKELKNFLDSGYMKTLMANTYGLKVPAMEKKVKELMVFAEGTLKEEIESLNERMDKRQAAELLKQLGGNKFIMMTGAKNFVVGPKGAGFKIGRNSKGINYVRIDLDGRDLYNMEFIQLRGVNMKVKSKETGVYFDQLQKLFTKNTGMYTSL